MWLDAFEQGKRAAILEEQMADPARRLLSLMTPYTPSDAEIEAALKAFYGTDKYGDALQERAFMRAALIAAATARTNEQRERVGT